MAQFSAVLRTKVFGNKLLPLLNFPKPTTAISKRNWCCINDSPYSFSKPNKSDYYECIKLMWETYIKEEPIMKHLQLTKTINSPLDAHIYRMLSQGLSLLVKTNEKHKLLGVCVNTTRNFHNPDILERFATTLHDNKLKPLFLFWAHIQKLPRRNSVPKIFEISHLFLRNENKELGKVLVEKSIQNAVHLGYKIIRLNATSAELANIAEEQGMKIICELPYTYFTENIKPIRNWAPPSYPLKIYVKKTDLQEDSNIMSSDEKSTVKMSGYLEKKSKIKVMSSWKNYWFVLEGRLLLYYRSKDTLSPCKGSINLGPRCTVKPAAGGTCIFQIETRSNTIVLKAPNRLEQEKWLQAILAALNQSPTNPNGMVHFRYSSDDLMPSPPTDNVKPFTFTRQYTMPERLQTNRSEIKQRLQNIGAKSYGGSLETIQKLAKGKSPQAVKRRNLVQKKQSMSTQDVSFTCGDDDLYSNMPKRKTYGGADSTCSLLVNNDQYCTADDIVKKDQPTNKTHETIDVLVENDEYGVVNEAGEETEKTASKSRTTCNFILDNDQYITTAEADDDKNELKCRSSESITDEDTEMLRLKVIENIYERVSGDSQLESSAILVDNENYVVNPKDDADVLVENDQYSIAKEVMQETDTVNYHEYNIPTKQDSENIYSVPQTDTDLNDNNVSSEGHQNQNADLNPYSICQIYPKKSQPEVDEDKLYEVVPDEYSEPILPPRPETAKTCGAHSTLLSRLRKFSLHGGGHDKDVKVVKKASFIRKLFKKKDRKDRNPTAEEEEQTYVTIDECIISKLDKSAEIDKQVLEELQKILMNKKDALIVQMKAEATSNEDTLQTNNEKLMEELAGKSSKPALPHKQKKSNDCLPFAKLKGRVRKSNEDCVDQPEKLKTIDEILNDLNIEKQQRDIKLGKVKTPDKEGSEEECAQNVKQLIDKFNKVNKTEEIILRQKTPTSQEKITEENEHRHSDELNRLLNELIKVTNAPILTPGVTSSLGVTRIKDDELLSMISSKPRRFSDPDYDVPRPHSNLKIERSNEKGDNMLTATRFFGPVLSSNQNNLNISNQTSITPDSLEMSTIRTSRDDDMASSYSSHNYMKETGTSPLTPTFPFFFTNDNFTQHSLQNLNQFEKDYVTQTMNLLESPTSSVFMDSLEPIIEKSTVL